MLLLLNVLLNDRKRRTADGAHEVRIGPQRWQLLFQHGKLLPQHSRGAAFEQTDQTMDAELWIAFEQEVYMVRHHLHADDVSVMLTRRFADDVGKSSGNLICEHLASVLGAPDDMILAGVVHVLIGFVVRLCNCHVNSIQHRAIYYQGERYPFIPSRLRRNSSHIPIAGSQGFYEPD